MHTLAKNADANARLVYDFLERAYPDGKPDFDTLVKDNIINGTQLLEIAVSQVDDIPMCPVGYNRDLIDDSDVKTVTVREVNAIKKKTLKSGKRRRYKCKSFIAAIKRVDKKFGVLRVICYNPFLDKYHYFLIPPSAVYGSTSIAMTFDKETKEPIGKYAEFVVPNFEELSKTLSLRYQIDTIVCNINKKNITEKIDELVELMAAANYNYVVVKD
tara:strand:- start:4579 stop:5223 length:645 start_codon:yes stop_codon:yes gene_type:complete